MLTGISRPLIFVFISLLVALVYSSMSAFNVFAAPNAAPSNAECKEYTTSIPGQGFTTVTDCCWTETDPDDPEGIELYYCQECTQNGCAEKRPASQGPTRPPSGPVAPLQGGVLEQPPTPPTSGPGAPLQGGVLEEQQQEPPTPPTFAPGTSPGVLEQLEQSEGVSPGFSERQQPLTRICPVGNVWDPSLMICVPDVPPIELCPDGSIPQPTGPGGTQPECPPSEAQQLQAEEPEQTPAEEPEQPEAQEEPQEQPSDGGGEEQSDQEDQQQSSEDGSGAD